MKTIEAKIRDGEEVSKEELARSCTSHLWQWQKIKNSTQADLKNFVDGCDPVFKKVLDSSLISAQRKKER